MSNSLLAPAGVQFIAEQGWGDATVSPLAGDASFRRYFRLHRSGESAVLMESPPAREALEPFVAIGRHLAALGLSVPRIAAADPRAGYALLEDLGDGLYPSAIAGGASEQLLYEAATDVLAHVHGAGCPEVLPGVSGVHTVPRFTAERLQDEVNRLLEWYWPHVIGHAATAREAADHAAAWAPMWALLDASPPVLVQFDYHSPNLLWLPERAGIRRVGVLDFQDALLGAGAYDLVSLLQDARRDLPPGLEPLMIERYLAARPDVDAGQFRLAYAILGAQRAARILGTFVRLWQRDGKPGYLVHQPRLWRYVERSLAHPALAPVRHWFDRHVPARCRADYWRQS